MKRCLFLLPLVLCHLSLEAVWPYQLSIQGELCHFLRAREGGTEQSGFVNGCRISLERFQNFSFYAGIDYFFSAGRLSGKTGGGTPLYSAVSDQILEIRLGYMFQQAHYRYPFFIPYGGWGSFREINEFKDPSPIPCRFTDTFKYVVAGFLSGANFSPVLSMGVNFKVKFMLDGHSKVSEDPFSDDVTLLMENELQCRVEIPLSLVLKRSLISTRLQLSPFYEFRHFGGREGFPSNFRDTKFYLYGAQLALYFQY